MSHSRSPVALLESHRLKYWVLLDSQAVNPYTCLVGGGGLFSESEERSTDFWQDSNLTAVSFFAAPTGRLDWWIKVSGDHTHKQLNIHLFWKVYKRQAFIFFFFVKSASKMTFCKFYILEIQIFPCQRAKHILCCVLAKTARREGKVVLHDGELLHFHTA